MVALIELLLRDPIKGILVILFMLFLYLWKEQGKIKTEIFNVERFLDKKKLDKEDFNIYSNNHEEIHRGFVDHLKTAIDLLKGVK